MAQAVKLSEDMVADVRVFSAALNRSLSGQIEHWARIGKTAEENPDLTYEMIKNLLITQQEAKSEILEPYKFSD